MSIPATETNLELGFDERWYLAEYPDVKEAVLAGMFSSGLAHYLAYGRRERRRPGPINGSPQGSHEADPAPIVAPNNDAGSTPVAAEGVASTDAGPAPSSGVISAPLHGDGKDTHSAARVVEGHDSGLTHLVAEQARSDANPAGATAVMLARQGFGAEPGRARHDVGLVAATTEVMPQPPVRVPSLSEVGKMDPNVGANGGDVVAAAPSGYARQKHVAAKAVADPAHLVAELVQGRSDVRPPPAKVEIVPKHPDPGRTSFRARPLDNIGRWQAIDLRWTLRDVRAKRRPINADHLKTLIEIGLVQMRDNEPLLTNAGNDALL